MIGKEDIRDRAAEWQLRMDVVEKDYILGWLLAALAQHPESSRKWVFKGGTCLKKCFFETYRFSEDLDFSLLPDAVYTADQIRRVLGEVCRKATELSGIEFRDDQVIVEERKNLQGDRTFEARLAYRGPLAMPTYPKVRFDLTRNEPVLDAVTSQSVFHAYPDDLPADIRVPTYSLDELFAEKTRALFERTRPRDLYDVVFILENRAAALQLDHARELLGRKCGIKNLTAPTRAELLGRIRGSDELKSEWANMLRHQLPELPPIEVYLDRLPGLLSWIDGPVAAPMVTLVSAPARRGEELVLAGGLHYWGEGVPLEAVRFAGANRLLVEFTYHGQARQVEPYSFRRSTTGKLLFYGWERASDQIKAFHTVEMTHVRATSVPFTPRFAVELTSSGPLPVRAATIRMGRPANRRVRRSR